MAQTQMYCAPAHNTFQLDISDTQDSTNQKSRTETVLNEKLIFLQMNNWTGFCLFVCLFLSKGGGISNGNLELSWDFWLHCC